MQTKHNNPTRGRGLWRSFKHFRTCTAPDPAVRAVKTVAVSAESAAEAASQTN